MFRRLLAPLILLVCFVVLSVRADDTGTQAPPKPQSTQSKEDAAIEQERLARQFRDFESALLQMAQRMERSGKQEDRERAVNLKEAIKKARESDIPGKFDTLITHLKANKAANMSEIKEAMDRSQMLADDIQAVLALLLNDNRDAQLKAEKERLLALIKMLDQVTREQKIVRAQNEAGRTEKKTLGKAQDKVTKATENVAKAMGKDGKDGKPKDGQPKSGQPKDGQPKDGQPKDGQKPNDSPGKKDVEDAIKDQKQAQDNIDKEKKNEASNNQDEAIKKLEEARKRLEEILRQLREEEKQRLLAALEQRCQRMLAMQIEVYEGTVRVDKAITENPDRKPSRAEEQRCLQLSDREQEIVRQANQAIQLLETEGSAVAFPEVFHQIRDDMQSVARRLNKADVGEVTQTIEQDIIGLLKDMIEALKKAQSTKPPPPGQGQSGQSGTPPLIDILAELKMIRSLQIRVNTRTLTYARQYQGEQAKDSDIQKELQNLAQRQLQIFETTNNIARGKNR